MLRAHRQPDKAERLQLLADRALVHHHAEPRLDHTLQIDAAPAHDAVLLRVRALLDQFGKRRQIARAQPARRTRIVAVRQAQKPLGIVAMHPIAQRLPIHPAGLGRRLAINPLQDQRQRQHPARRTRVGRLPRRQTQFRRRQICPRDRDRRHFKPPSLQQQHRVRLSAIRESLHRSEFTAVGITINQRLPLT